MNRPRRLHSRISMVLIAGAVVSLLGYVIFTVAVIEELEESAMATLVGHEIEEIVTGLEADRDVALAHSATVNAFLASRDQQDPVPDYLRVLPPGIHDVIQRDGKILHVSILDFADDRIFIEFDVTGVKVHKQELIWLLIGGGLAGVGVLAVFAVWQSRRYLRPISDLADALQEISPDARNDRIGNQFAGYEVGVIAESIDTYLERFDEFVEQKQAFSSAVSHELRTPVSVISTSLDLLEFRGLDDRRQAVVDRIRASTVYMGNVIESLLLFSDKTFVTAALDLSMPPVHLNTIFDRVVENYRVATAKKGIELEAVLEPGVHAHVVDSHIEIILGNLVRNAINNTQQGSVRIELNDSGFAVVDTGRGIEKSVLDNILKLNFRDQHSSGFGVGLYLVKVITENYHMDLSIDSELGAGTRFSVFFPPGMVCAPA